MREPNQVFFRQRSLLLNLKDVPILKSEREKDKHIPCLYLCKFCCQYFGYLWEVKTEGIKGLVFNIIKRVLILLPDHPEERTIKINIPSGQSVQDENRFLLRADYGTCPIQLNPPYRQIRKSRKGS